MITSMSVISCEKLKIMMYHAAMKGTLGKPSISKKCSYLKYKSYSNWKEPTLKGHIMRLFLITLETFSTLFTFSPYFYSLILYWQTVLSVVFLRSQSCYCAMSYWFRPSQWTYHMEVVRVLRLSLVLTYRTVLRSTYPRITCLEGWVPSFCMLVQRSERRGLPL